MTYDVIYEENGTQCARRVFFCDDVNEAAQAVLHGNTERKIVNVVAVND